MSRNKIFDCITFFDENLITNSRFEILNSVVDYFIVCESRFSHSGVEKEIKFNKKNFPKFEKKIIHAVVDKEPDEIIKKNNLNYSELRHNSVLRIKQQRNFIKTI